jgi:hypothetical protein
VVEIYVQAAAVIKPPEPILVPWKLGDISMTVGHNADWSHRKGTKQRNKQRLTRNCCLVALYILGGILELHRAALKRIQYIKKTPIKLSSPMPILVH